MYEDNRDNIRDDEHKNEWTECTGQNQAAQESRELGAESQNAAAQNSASQPQFGQIQGQNSQNQYGWQQRQTSQQSQNVQQNWNRQMNGSGQPYMQNNQG